MEVTWLDAARGEYTTDDAPQRTFGIVRRTLGWLVRDQKAGILLAMSKDDSSYERWFSIPRPYIMSLREVTIHAAVFADRAGSPGGGVALHRGDNDVSGVPTPGAE